MQRIHLTFASSETQGRVKGWDRNLKELREALSAVSQEGNDDLSPATARNKLSSANLEELGSELIPESPNSKSPGSQHLDFSFVRL